MSTTFQTRVKEDKVFAYLEKASSFFSSLERKLFVDLFVKKKPLTELKKAYLIKYSITGRQFNSLSYSIRGKIESVLSLNKLYIKETGDKLNSIAKWLTEKQQQKDKMLSALHKLKPGSPKFMDKLKKYQNLKFVIHQKKRRFRNLTQKLIKLEKDKEKQIVRICFGSKKLFKAQHYLGENNLKSHDHWKVIWREQRSNQFFVLGSKDESFGNQSCTYMLDNSLRIRVADKFEKEFGQYQVINEVCFPYGQEHFDLARKYKVVYDNKGKKKKEFQSISYRFCRRDGKWYIFATLDRKDPDTSTNIAVGAIGVDLNNNFLVMGEVDRFGNPLGEKRFQLLMQDRSTGQINAQMGAAIRQIVLYAKQTGKPCIIEGLDFSKKKAQLREMGVRYSRMLSGLTYKKFKEMFKSRAAREGVEVIEKDPFATSLAGHFRFMVRYGLSSHGAAACVIARRGLGLRLEKLPVETIIPLPVFKRHSQRKPKWSVLSKKVKDISFKNRINLLYAGYV